MKEFIDLFNADAVHDEETGRAFRAIRECVTLEDAEQLMDRSDGVLDVVESII